MNNTFEGYLNVSKYTDYTHFSSLNEIKEVLHKEKIILLNLSNQKQIKDFSDYLNKTWNLIDLSNFHFYQTDNFKFGGIDEYAMEKFGNISFVASHEPKDIPKHGYIVGFGAHPHESVYVNFFIDYMYDKLKPFIGELQFDFTDRWQFSKHNSIRKTK
jgi:hypothetical protein